MGSVSDIELRLLRALEDCGQAVPLELASASLLAPSAVAEAIRRLKEEGLIKVVGKRDDRELLQVDEGTLSKQLL